MSEIPTARQLEVLRYWESVCEGSDPPSLREAGRHFDVQHVAIRGHCEALVAKGWMTKTHDGKYLPSRPACCPTCGQEWVAGADRRKTEKTQTLSGRVTESAYGGDGR